VSVALITQPTALAKLMTSGGVDTIVGSGSPYCRKKFGRKPRIPRASIGQVLTVGLPAVVVDILNLRVGDVKNGDVLLEPAGVLEADE
jgi:hypothetical protein